MSEPINERPSDSLRDPHGEAALLLVESLIHGLLRRSQLTLAEAIDIVQVAIDVEAETGHDRGDDPTRASPAALRLTAMLDSLRIDRPGGAGAPAAA
jgi:hypothetical protein